MEVFGGSLFWNTNTTWLLVSPYFTPCFEGTAFVWIPCLFLWLLTPIELHFIRRRFENKKMPLGRLLKSILAVTAGLATLSIIDLFTASRDVTVGHEVDFFSPSLKIITFILSSILLVCNQKGGERSSNVLSMFWFMLLVCGLTQFSEDVSHAHSETEKNHHHVMYLPLVALNFLLTCFVGPSTKSDYDREENKCPQRTSSFFSQLTMSWFDKLIWKCRHESLEIGDIWELNAEDTSSANVRHFNRHFQRSLDASARKSNGDGPKYNASILPALLKCFGGAFVFAACLELVGELMRFLNPHILRILMDYADSDDPLWKGIAYAAAILAAEIAQAMMNSQSEYYMSRLELRMQSALTAAVYQKLLRLSPAALSESSTGQILNLMTDDAQIYVSFWTRVYTSPLMICVALYLLWNCIGVAVLGGVLVLVCLVPLNHYVSKKLETFGGEQSTTGDDRVNAMNERLQIKQRGKFHVRIENFQKTSILKAYKALSLKKIYLVHAIGLILIFQMLQGIRVLKLYAWEVPFARRVDAIRAQEMKLMDRQSLTNAIIESTYSIIPVLVTLASFATYLLIDRNNILDAQKVFYTLSIFSILEGAVNSIPNTITTAIKEWVSIGRLSKFLCSDELSPDSVSHTDEGDMSLVIENGTFSWGSEATLHNINLHVKSGQLVAVMGKVGAGKSSLLSAALGEIQKKSGRVSTKGSIAYVPQRAWIQQATLRDNILFGRPMDRRRYERVLDACAIREDLAMLPNGDETQIGEKGVNLSGGQKQRVSLARALYWDADLYLLDDPLSAVDSHVGKHIFDTVIGPRGALRNKTRVLVTHGVSFLPEVDMVAVLVNGTVSESGSYEELLQGEGALSRLLAHSKGGEEEDVMESLDAEADGKNVARQLSRTSSSGSTALRRRRINSSLDTEDEESDSEVESDDDEMPIFSEKAFNRTWKDSVYVKYICSIGMKTVLVTVILHCLHTAFTSISSIWLTKWTDDSDMKNPNSSDFEWKRNMYLGGYAAFEISQVVLQALSRHTFGLASNKASRELHDNMLKRIIRCPITFFDTTPIGKIVKQFSDVVSAIDFVLPTQIIYYLSIVFAVLEAVSILIYCTPIIFIALVPLAIIYVYIERLHISMSRQLTKMRETTSVPMYSHFTETLSGLSLIRAFGETARFTTEVEQKTDMVARHQSLASFSQRWLSLRFEFLSALSVFFSSLFIVLGRGNITAAFVGLSARYALKVTNAFSSFVYMSSFFESSMVSIRKITEFSETPQTLRSRLTIIPQDPWLFSGSIRTNLDPEGVLSDEQLWSALGSAHLTIIIIIALQESEWLVRCEPVPEAWPHRGVVRFEDFSLRYRDGLDLVLKNITFTANAGEKVGIVGRTGAGKSSLTQALFRTVEAAGGRILIDGVDISQVALQTLRSRLTIIPQDPWLFSGSIRTNLDPEGVLSDEQLWSALGSAHLTTLVEGFPEGLDHEITEGGENLSVGQRQLICLARALLRKTKILVFDEATAAVDLETESLIQKTIRKEFKHNTILTIAHRINTILDSDRVLVMHEGSVKEFESPQKLLQRKDSLFYGLVEGSGLVNEQ